MTKPNLLETIQILATEAAAEGARRDKQVAILQAENAAINGKHNDLLKDYDQLHIDCESAESTLALFKSNVAIDNKAAKKAFSELEEELEASQSALQSIQQVNEFLSGQNESLQEAAKQLKLMTRQCEVLTKDLAKAKAQVVRAKEAKPKQVKAPKKSMQYRQLEQQNAQLNKYIQELVDYGQKAPQFLGGLKHSTQGVMDMVDCKPEKMSVREKGGDEREVLVQRVIVINKNNSTKVMTRIIGEPGLHTCKIPTGGTVKIDDEVREHVEDYFKTLDDMSNKLKQQRKAA